MANNTTKAQPITATGIATLMAKGAPLATITSSPDGTYGWRSYGRMTVAGKDGASKEAYKFKKGFSDFQTAIAAAIVYARRHHKLDDADLAIGEYVAPERKGFGGGKRLVDSPAFQAAAALAAKFKLPAGVKKALAPSTPAPAPELAPAKEAPKRKDALKAAATKKTA